MTDQQHIMAPTSDEGGQGITDGGNIPGGQLDQGGQGGNGDQPTGEFGEFKTAEELLNDYNTKTEQLTSLQDQVKNLESLKGRQGGEIGQLRQQIATLTGQIEGMRLATREESGGSTLESIAKQLNDGDIDEVQAIKMAAEVSSKTTEANLRQMLADELGKFQNQTAHERYVEKFITDNPGYQKAFESGKLDPWLKMNPDGSISGGEYAWAQYQLQAKDAEIETLKKNAEAATAAAEQSGIDKGVKIEQGKSAAGKVLTGKGGQFSASEGKYDLSNPIQRRQAGIERLKQLRSG